ncbi:hypothetical protein GCM10027052_26770 [Parafrigoribacterium mesophilum]
MAPRCRVPDEASAGNDTMLPSPAVASVSKPSAPSKTTVIAGSAAVRSMVKISSPADPVTRISVTPVSARVSLPKLAVPSALKTRVCAPAPIDRDQTVGTSASGAPSGVAEVELSGAWSPSPGTVAVSASGVVVAASVLVVTGSAVVEGTGSVAEVGSEVGVGSTVGAGSAGAGSAVGAGSETAAGYIRSALFARCSPGSSTRDIRSLPPSMSGKPAMCPYS